MELAWAVTLLLKRYADMHLSAFLPVKHHLAPSVVPELHLRLAPDFHVISSSCSSPRHQTQTCCYIILIIYAEHHMVVCMTQTLLGSSLKVILLNFQPGLERPTPILSIAQRKEIKDNQWQQRL